MPAFHRHAHDVWSKVFRFIKKGQCHSSTMFVRASYTGSSQVSALFSFPNRLQNLVNEMLRTNTQLGQIRKLSIGGSQVTETLARGALKVFPKLHNLRNFYGMTESCGLIAAPGQDEINFEDLGIPSPNVEIKVWRPTCIKLYS